MWGCAGGISLLCCLLSRSIVSGEKGKNAIALTRDTFDSFLQGQRDKNRAALVMFHVSWCKACQRTFPFFDAAAATVPSQGVEMDFGHVECTDDKTLCQKFEVQGYPTIKLFFPEADRAPQNFRGQRTEEGFLRYAKRMTTAPVRSLASASELVQAMAFEPFAALLIADRHVEALTFVAQRYMDRHIIASAPSVADLLPEALKDAAGAASLAVLASPAQLWPGRGTATFSASYYEGSMDNLSVVADWVARNRFPGVWALGEGNFYEFTHSDRPAVLVALGPEVGEDLEQEIRGAQREFSQEFLFGALNGSHWSEELKMFNIHPQELPRVLMSEKNFEIWIEDVQALRPDALRGDLAALQAGAPLLRQGRTILGKILFWKREAGRFVVRMGAHASKGWMEALMVAGAAFSFLVLVVLLGMCLITCCNALFSDEEPDVAAAAAKLKKRQ